MSQHAPTLRTRIRMALDRNGPMTDRELTDLLFDRSTHPAAVNQECRMMAGKRLIIRDNAAGGSIRNRLSDPSMPASTAAPQSSIPPAAPESMERPRSLSEDALKRHVTAWLERDGWHCQVAWGKTPGIDIRATRSAETWIIEAKGEGSLSAMRVNYFLAVLGELLQRMTDPNARYAIALPDMPQFRGLWNRLPDLAKRRVGLSALFVSHDGAIDHLEPEESLFS